MLEQSSNFATTTTSQPSKFEDISQFYEETRQMEEDEVCHLSKEEQMNALEALEDKAYR